MVDLFTSNEHTQPFRRRRPRIKDDDPDEIRARASMTNEEEFELVLRRSREKKMR